MDSPDPVAIAAVHAIRTGDTPRQALIRSILATLDVCPPCSRMTGRH